ncbi:hypothetical protein DFO47_10667 [Arthrobacter sp. AG258]|nr:hypothetical protein DFO47_10667 [Arthrobacter sp. AG258]
MAAQPGSPLRLMFYSRIALAQLGHYVKRTAAEYLHWDSGDYIFGMSGFTKRPHLIYPADS